MRGALLRSGYLLEARVSAYLRTAGLQVANNPAYSDPITGRSRELDVEASGIHREIQVHHPDEIIWAELLVECVNPPRPLVFFATEQPKEWDGGYERVKVAEPPTQQAPRDFRYNWYWLLREIDAASCHHYFAPGVISSQYCSFDRKKGGHDRGSWFAQHREQDYEALRAIVAATDHLTRQHHDYMDEEFPWLQLAFFFPVLIVQGELLEASPTARSVRLVKKEHVRLHWSRSEGRESHRYVIDVITERKLPEYLRLVTKTIEGMASRIKERMPAVFIDAIDRAKEFRAGKARDSSSPVSESIHARGRAELEAEARMFGL
jgi:hypothetical protein